MFSAGRGRAPEAFLVRRLGGRLLPARGPLDAIASHLVVDARAVNAEALGRLTLVAARQPEGLRDGELLDLLQREMRRNQRSLLLATAVHLRRQVLGTQDLAAPQHDGALDGILELPHVPGPGIREEHV